MKGGSMYGVEERLWTIHHKYLVGNFKKIIPLKEYIYIKEKLWVLKQPLHLPNSPQLNLTLHPQ